MKMKGTRVLCLLVLAVLFLMTAMINVTINAQGQSSGVISISPTNIPTGAATTINVHGRGFVPGDMVLIEQFLAAPFEAGQGSETGRLASLTVESGGTFDTSISLPAVSEPTRLYIMAFPLSLSVRSAETVRLAPKVLLVAYDPAQLPTTGANGQSNTDSAVIMLGALVAAVAGVAAISRLRRRSA